MTRIEKLALCDNHYLPVIEARLTQKQNAFENYVAKATSYNDKIAEYEAKKAEINNYYDLVEALGGLQEPVIE